MKVYFNNIYGTFVKFIIESIRFCQILKYPVHTSINSEVTYILLLIIILNGNFERHSIKKQNLINAVKVLSLIFYYFSEIKNIIYSFIVYTYGLYSLNAFKLMSIKCSSDFNNDNVETTNNN